MLHRRSVIIALAATAAAAIPLYHVFSPQTSAGHRLVAILPLTGTLAVIGTPKREAMELALAHAREAYPSLKLEIEYQDSQASVTNAVSILNQVIATNPPDSLFIDMTPIVDACTPIVDQKKILTFAGSAQAGITRRSNYLYRIFPGGDQEVRVIVEHLRQRKPKGIFVLHANELYGRSIKNAMLTHKADLPLTGFEEFAPTDRDFRAQLSKARESGADVIAVFGYGNEYATMLTQAQELGLPATMFVANIGAVNIGVTRLAPPLTEGMVFAAPAFALKSGTPSAPPEQQKLEAAYQAKYGKAADFRVAFIYDTIMLLARELSRGVDSSGLQTALQKIDAYHGASGSITVSSSRDAQAEVVAGIYRAGKPSALSEPK